MANQRAQIWNFIILLAAIINAIKLLQVKLFKTSEHSLNLSQCDIEMCGNCSMEINQPYIALGPSKIEEIVAMSILQKKIQFDSFKGLRYLDQTSLSRYYRCKPSENVDNNASAKWCSERTFLDRSLPLVALVSFHGSGNTWLRYLLEQATGIFTGSIYCDTGLKSLFPGEFVASGNVIAIKTHHADSRALPKDVQLSSGKEIYHKAIVLVRNPFDALVSEANRRWNSKRFVNSHIGLASETSFLSNSKWDGLVDYKGVAWSFLLHTWLAQNETQVHVVQYEKLIHNTEDELSKILAFLNVAISQERMNCVLENANGVFKRKKHLNFNPFSKENNEVMNRHMLQAIPLLAKYNITYDARN